MTNKKFKVAAMSMALTACVAAQPLIANAADDVNAVSSNNTPAQASDTSAGSGTESKSTESNGTEGESNQSDGTNMESTETKEEAFGEHVDINYDRDNPKTDEKTGSTAITGKVVKKDGTEDKKDETEDKKDETGDKKDETGGEKKSDELVPPTDGGNIEKDEKNEDKKIGDATITETPKNTVTEDPVPKPGAEPVTKTDTKVTEDGTTIITDTTTLDATQTSTTTGSGHAKADTKETTKDTTDISTGFLKEELGNIDWNVEQNATVGTDEKNPYKVISKDEETTDNTTKQTLTLEKVEETKGHMTAEDIAKLVDADRDSVNKQADGSYTLKRTETVTDKDGTPVTRTTYITVREGTDEVSIKTTTTIKVTREKVEHHKEDDQNAFENDNTSDFKLPDIDLYDKETNKKVDSIDETKLNELINNENTTATPNGNQTTYTVTVEEDGVKREYEITKNSESSELTADEIAKRMGSDYEADGDKVYYVGAGQRVELTVDQTNVIREKLSYTVKVKETKKDKETVETGKDAAVAKAKNEAVRDALKNAVTKMLEEHTITEDEAKELNKNIANGSINAKDGGTFQTDITVDGVTKHFELDYSKGTITSTSETPRKDKDDDKTTDNTEHTVKGNAYVFGGKVVQESGGTVKNEDSTITFDNAGKVQLPDGATSLGNDEQGRLKGYTIGNTTYEFEYGTMKPEDAKTALGDKLNQEGWKLGDFDADITTVSWTAKTTKADSNSADIYDSTGCTIQQDENANTYTITVKGSGTASTAYAGLQKKPDGTYTGTHDGKSVTITVTDGDPLGNNDIETLIRQQYTDIVGNVTVDGSTATYTDKDGKTHTVSIRSAKNQTVLVQTVEALSPIYAQPQKTEQAVINDICTQLQGKLNALTVGQTLQVTGKDGKVATIKKTSSGYTLSESDKTDIKNVANVQELAKTIVAGYASNQINYDSLTSQEIWELLDVQQQYADGKNNSYTNGKGCDSYWTASGYENNGTTNADGTHNGEVPQYGTTTFDSLGLDANVTIEDAETGKKIDGVLLNDAKHSLTFTYGTKEQIAGYVDLSKYPDYDYNGNAYYNKDGTTGSLGTTKEAYHPITGATTADFTGTVAESKKGDYWNGTSYDKKDKLTYTVNNGSLTGKNFYQVIGSVAYDQHGSNYTSEAEAKAALAELKASSSTGEYDNGVIVPYTVNGATEYRVYGKVTNLKAYGYMTASANTSTNQNRTRNYSTWTPGNGAYWGQEEAGTYELRIQGLKKYGDTVTGQYGVGKSLDLSVLTENKGSAKHLDVSQTSTTSETDNGKGYYGSYTNTWTKTENWRNSDGTSDIEGDGDGLYTSFVRWVSNVFNGESGELTKEGGTFHYEYDYTTVGDLQGERLTQTVEKHAKVDYDYITEEVRNVKITDQEVTIITPDGDDDDGGDEIIEEKVPDSPVLPGTPELPPVQDAKPDAPVLPADPALPAVQDAHALPQTGVNWLAAIGLALSGMTLMITGAFASLLGKNAKH